MWPEMRETRESLQDYTVGLDGPGLPTFHESELSPQNHITVKVMGNVVHLRAHGKGKPGWETLSSPDTNVKGVQENL